MLEAVEFATKPSLACAMFQRALATDVPFSWVAADSVYGVGSIEMTLCRVANGYVFGVSSSHGFMSWGNSHAVSGTAKEIAAALPEDA